MDVKLVEKNKDGMQATVLIKGSTYQYINTARRYFMQKVPTMAIETIDFKQNSSVLYDEIVAHRLGLLVFTTDLKSYTLPAECTCNKEGCAKCQLKLTLKVKGPGMVYASDIKSKDPKVKPVHPKTPITKLLKDQELEFVATATLGKGGEHAKWSSGIYTYTFQPKITVNNKSEKFDTYKNKYPKKVFDGSGRIDKQKIIDNNLVDACAGVCDDIVFVDYEESSYLFRMESWGALSLKDIAAKAFDLFDADLDEFDKLVKNI